jgi:acyl carrier protein
MTPDELRRALLDSLAAVAPEARGRELAGGADLREELDLDSMDFLRVLVGIKERTGIDVPEADAPKLFTLEGALEYLSRRQP